MGIANSYLQSGHTVLLALVLLCGFVEIPGFPLTSLPYDVREFLKVRGFVRCIHRTDRIEPPRSAALCQHLSCEPKDCCAVRGTHAGMKGHLPAIAIGRRATDPLSDAVLLASIQ